MTVIPQIIWIVLASASLTHTLINHGKPRGEENFGTHLVAVALVAAVLYWGGFFNSLLGVQ